MGSRRLYDWLDRNPLVEMHPVSYTNNPAVIAQNRKMVAVNVALEVDLLGQVRSDTLGPDQYSGVGGQVDFVRGARLSEGGKAVIVLTSTALQRHDVPDRAGPEIRGGSDDVSQRRRLCGDGIRRRGASRQDRARADAGARRYRAPGLSGASRAGGVRFATGHVRGGAVGLYPGCGPL